MNDCPELDILKISDCQNIQLILLSQILKIWFTSNQRKEIDIIRLSSYINKIISIFDINMIQDESISKTSKKIKLSDNINEMSAYECKLTVI